MGHLTLFQPLAIWVSTEYLPILVITSTSKAKFQSQWLDPKTSSDLNQSSQEGPFNLILALDFSSGINLISNWAI